MKLDRCEGCGGFIPSTKAACPHCRSTRTRLGAAATLLASTAIGFTLMACYGGPPCADGSTSCLKGTPSTDHSAMPTSSVTPPNVPLPGTPDGGAGAKK